MSGTGDTVRGRSDTRLALPLLGALARISLAVASREAADDERRQAAAPQSQQGSSSRRAGRQAERPDRNEPAQGPSAGKVYRGGMDGVRGRREGSGSVRSALPRSQ